MVGSAARAKLNAYSVEAAAHVEGAVAQHLCDLPDGAELLYV
jgi:hypothetical protein